MDNEKLSYLLARDIGMTLHDKFFDYSKYKNLGVLVGNCVILNTIVPELPNNNFIKQYEED